MAAKKENILSQDYTADHVELNALAGIPMVNEGDNLADIITQGLSATNIELRDNDVLVLAQKIVSKAEGRLVQLKSVTPSPAACKLADETGKDPRLVELILSESSEVVRQMDGLVIVRHTLGFVMANAGIDQSNVTDNTALLLPVDPDKSASDLQAELKKRLGVNIAVIVSDSIGRAWRNGIAGHAIGIAGIPAVVDLRASIDLYGRELRVSEVAIADEVAAAAALLMGQGAEGKPAVVLRGLNVSRLDPAVHTAPLVRPKDRDLFQ